MERKNSPDGSEQPQTNLVCGDPNSVCSLSLGLPSGLQGEVSRLAAGALLLTWEWGRPCHRPELASEDPGICLVVPHDRVCEIRVGGLPWGPVQSKGRQEQRSPDVPLLRIYGDSVLEGGRKPGSTSPEGYSGRDHVHTIPTRHGPFLPHP